jgi:hypothetical protein
VIDYDRGVRAQAVTVMFAITCACDNNQAAIDAPGPDVPIGDSALPACQPSSGTTISLRFITATQGVAILAVSPPDDPRVFVIEQEGRIRRVGNGEVSDPFLDVSHLISCCGEQGLLGLAFHPSYATNGTFFIFYTTDNANVLARYRVSATDPNVADPDSGVVLLSIPDFAANHNGGMLEFGPDGYLYFGTGDGGGGGDPHLNGQNPHALLGKILRIDVDSRAPGMEYGIPPSNPYADGIAGAPEVWMFGTRNPWRWAFDRVTGDMWIGDVGQGAVEELDMIPAGGGANTNFGWSTYEGSSCYNGGNGNGSCTPAGITMPVFEETHTDGWCAIIGGDVYRGACYPDLAGAYLFTDYCKAILGVGTKTAGNAVTVAFPATTFVQGDTTYTGFPTTPSGLHKAAGGELYLTTTTCCGSSATGAVFRVEAGP